jgi:hypothetical protein
MAETAPASLGVVVVLPVSSLKLAVVGTSKCRVGPDPENHEIIDTQNRTSNANRFIQTLSDKLLKLKGSLPLRSSHSVHPVAQTPSRSDYSEHSEEGDLISKEERQMYNKFIIDYTNKLHEIGIQKWHQIPQYEKEQQGLGEDSLEKYLN